MPARNQNGCRSFLVKVPGTEGRTEFPKHPGAHIEGSERYSEQCALVQVVWVVPAVGHELVVALGAHEVGPAQFIL